MSIALHSSPEWTYLCNAYRISKHADDVRDNCQRRTAVENSCVHSIVDRVPKVTKQNDARNAFGKDDETVRKYDANSAADVINDPQTTSFIRLQSQQITKWGNIDCFN